MSDYAPESTEPPKAAVTVVYLGPVAPHWDVRSDFGDKVVVDEFYRRLNARLMLVPPHDPQFRRNRERVVRDAERENIELSWDPAELADAYNNRDRGDRPERGDRGDRRDRGDRGERRERRY